MNPAPFVFYRDQLVRLALSATASAAPDDARTAATEAPSAAASEPAIAIRLAGAVLQVAAGADGALLAEVLQAVRNSALRRPGGDSAAFAILPDAAPYRMPYLA
jgi:hypothetical protein